jgi:Lon protease-like protein
MLRRCLESRDHCFGVMPGRTGTDGAAPGAAAPFDSDYGTMLRICYVNMFPDGRSLVHTVGSHRFRILERATRDGYMVARTEMCVPPP